MPSLKEVPKAKAPDQAKMPPSQKDWGVCLSLLSVHCPQGGSLLVCQELALGSTTESELKDRAHLQKSLEKIIVSPKMCV